MTAHSLPVCPGAQGEPITTESGHLARVWTCAWVWYQELLSTCIRPIVSVYGMLLSFSFQQELIPAALSPELFRSGTGSS